MSASKITTVKSVPAEDCLERKVEEKGVLLKDRKGLEKYSRLVVMVTAPSNVS